MITCNVDAMEQRYIVTCDNPGAFMHADMDELVHIKPERELAELLVRLDPTHRQYVTTENGKKVIYAELTKALFGTAPTLHRVGCEPVRPCLPA